MTIPCIKSFTAVAKYPPATTKIAVRIPMAIIQYSNGTPKAIEKSRERPLYSDAVYGTIKINTMIEAPIFKAGEKYRLPKNSGIVALPR